jgi:hypothetical protein
MSREKRSAKVAYPAILGALSLLCLYIAGIIPSGTWGLVALAGVFPAGAVISVGMGAGFLCWGGVSVLAFLLLPDKFSVLLYAVLFGLYPMIKALIERKRLKGIAYAFKLVFFNAAFTLIFVVMKAAVLDSLPAVLSGTWVIYLIANVVFLIYDFGFSKLIGFYIVRIGRSVK